MWRGECPPRVGSFEYRVMYVGLRAVPLGWGARGSTTATKGYGGER
jgi:hypothetical protein